MEKETFIFYQSFWEVVKRLPEETGNAVLRALIEYGIERKEYAGNDAVVAAIIAGLSPQIDAAKANRKGKKRGAPFGNQNATQKNKYQNKAKTNKRYNSLQSNDLQNKAKTKQKQIENKDKTNSRIYVNVDGDVDVDVDVDGNVNDFSDEKYLEKTSPVGDEKKSLPQRGFVKPSIDELRDYCDGKGYGFDPEAFIAFYESNGWRVSRNPMRDWKMACVTWQKRFEEDRRREEERRARHDRDRASPPPKELIKSPIPEYSDEEWNRLPLWEQDEAVHRHYGI